MCQKGGCYIVLIKHGSAVYAQKYCHACITCATHNVDVPVAVTSTTNWTFWSQYDGFCETHVKNVKKTLSRDGRHVVKVGWNVSVQTATNIAKAFITEIIQTKISSENGFHFVNQAITEISASMEIDLETRHAYHPASGSWTGK